MNDRQALSSEKRFLSPRRGSNPQPSHDRWDAVTIHMVSQSTSSAYVRPEQKLLYVNYVIDEIYILLLMRCIFWKLTIWFLVAQRLERLTGHQKVAS